MSSSWGVTPLDFSSDSNRFAVTPLLQSRLHLHATVATSGMVRATRGLTLASSFSIGTTTGSRACPTTSPRCRACTCSFRATRSGRRRRRGHIPPPRHIPCTFAAMGTRRTRTAPCRRSHLKPSLPTFSRTIQPIRYPALPGGPNDPPGPTTKLPSNHDPTSSCTRRTTSTPTFGCAASRWSNCGPRPAP